VVGGAYERVINTMTPKQVTAKAPTVKKTNPLPQKLEKEPQGSINLNTFNPNVED
jgi:hypothetical protein